VPGRGVTGLLEGDHRLVGVAGGQQRAAPLEQLVGVDVDDLLQVSGARSSPVGDRRLPLATNTAMTDNPSPAAPW
jgi:hypothetical protein